MAGGGEKSGNWDIGDRESGEAKPLPLTDTDNTDQEICLTRNV